MKKIYSTIAVLAISSLAILSSCSKKNEGSVKPASVDVTVYLNQNGNTNETKTLYVERDRLSAVVQVNGISSTSTEMKRIYVYKKSKTTSSAGTYVTYNGTGFLQDANNNYYYDIPVDQKNNTSLTLTINLNTGSLVAVSDEYYFVFTNGASYGGPNTTAGMLLGPAKIIFVYGKLSETTGHRINNIRGPKSGAFDFITLENVSSSASIGGKDIVDFDDDATWDKSFYSESGTLFAKIPSTFDYEHATDFEILAAYNSAGNATDTQTGVVAGDMFVAKLRGLDFYILIKVTFISEETGETGPGKNNEYMEFSVKK